MGELLTLFSLTIPWANSADEKLVKCFLFSHKTRFDISCKLSPIGMKCQILFSEKIKKNILN